MANPILILSGPVGAGKSTVAREVIQMLPRKVVWIEGDRFWPFLAKGFGPRPTSATLRVVMASMLAAAVPLAPHADLTLVDFSVPPWFLQTALKIMAVREVPLQFVVLRPSLDVCAQRTQSRTEGAVPDYTRFVDLYHDFDEVEARFLEAGVQPAAESAARIVAGVEAGRFRVS